jgi:hypothetical protein
MQRFKTYYPPRGARVFVLVPKAAVTLQAETLWEDYAAAGDTPEDCLNEKISIKRRDNVGTVKDITLPYIKRLRALGWHLHFRCERYLSKSRFKNQAFATWRAFATLKLNILLMMV